MDVRINDKETEWLQDLVKRKCAKAGIAVRSIGPSRRVENLMNPKRYTYAYPTKSHRPIPRGMPLLRALELWGMLIGSDAGRDMTRREIRSALNRIGLTRLLRETSEPGDDQPYMLVFEGQSARIADHLADHLKLNGHISAALRDSIKAPLREFFQMYEHIWTTPAMANLHSALSAWRPDYKKVLSRWGIRVATRVATWAETPRR